MSFDVMAQPETLIEQMNNLKAARKKEILYVCVSMAFMFINVFVTVFLTGERELYEFSSMDWVIFAIMGAIEIATIVMMFYFADKTGKKEDSD